MPDHALTVTVDGGSVRGVRRGPVDTWRGIPFAAPALGPLRFRAPQPVHAWEGVRDASQFGEPPSSGSGSVPARGTSARTR
ncbi:carboxylesterase family protein [Naumannella halotolerans]|uniref:carboxylesterase family protein n=1 Tax=Naumannella halotolerans TaxID=993414 RepID=UPI00105D4C12